MVTQVFSFIFSLLYWLVMNYFFTFLLQALLPFSLLLGIYQNKHYPISAKKVIWLSLFAFIGGLLFRLNLPAGQQVQLVGSSVFLVLLVIFGFFMLFARGRFSAFWQVILMFIAATFWAKDPNISALISNDIINTDTILQLSAVVFAFMFCLCLQGWLYLLCGQAEQSQMKSVRLFYGLFGLLLIYLLLPLLGEVLLSLMKLQVLELTKLRLSLVAKSAELTFRTNYFVALLLGLSLLLFYLKIHLLRKKQLQASDDAIDKRKKMAALRNSGRILGWGLLATLTVLSVQLYWQEVASKPPQLSEAMAVNLDDKQQIHIPIEQVKDGKLHRFVWIADDGKAVRFFVINRQADKLSLAVVFDACLLCGDQGYVMQDNQVICVGCGVHMFIPSIGKPGGCNPVPIEDWQQTESEILINRSNLEEGLNLFSTIVEIEVKDPISGAKMKNTHTEHKYSYEGRTYFFENEKNLDLFRDDPEKYLGKEE
ncbi:Predicted membrane protein [Haemophilus pittmaniae]|uniref:Predicted membrane protein n=3 Tax=Haemophilus pittmaniae TaxID=249188 RepID=A0A377IZV7_9PAST|nr:Predicted membrane protein [Haemophilus pittmaniae]